ncbi:MAG TPA: DUF3189 family protein [Syntrophomonadaceae bacterium]|nr:DUF3189 family protein [Syntrophomonadaceae bacterium]
MKIIYHCYGGSHSSVLAAAIHLGLIDKFVLPSREALFNLPIFDKTTDEDFGTIRKMGTDELGHEIYVLGKKNLGDRYTNILEGTAKILGVKEDLLVINIMDKVNWIMKIGGFSSRRLGLITFGRFFLFHGTIRAFLPIVNLVVLTKSEIQYKD